MNSKPKTNPSLLLLNHPLVVRPVRTTLRSFGMKAEQDLEEGVSEVQTRTLEHLRDKPVPTELAEWVALCTTIARNWQLDMKKKRKTAQKYDTGLCEDPEERTGLEPSVSRPDALDARRMVRVLRDQFDAGEMPPQGDEILDCVQAKMTSPAIGKELGISETAARKRLERMRSRFSARLTRLGMMVLTVQLLVVAVAGTAAASPHTEPTLKVPVPPPRASHWTLAA